MGTTVAFLAGEESGIYCVLGLAWRSLIVLLPGFARPASSPPDQGANQVEVDLD